jgi:predicted RNA-binding protein with PUA-like domain
MAKNERSKNYWLMKSEPDAYGWDDLCAEKEGTWDGVRNHRAANNLRAMKVGDETFFYHSNVGREIVGIATVSVDGITDPTDPENKWAAVKIKPVRKLKRPISLKEIKADPKLADIELIRLSRLSVAEITPKEWDYIIAMSERDPPD